MADQNYSRAQAAPTSYEDLSRKDVATDVYTAFRNAGYSDSQAQALTAEINRENNLLQQYMFGSHTDPANQATNVGMLSWQGSRAPAVMEFLRERGAVGEDGKITPGFDTIQAQADFIRQEMETSPEYARTREQFLSNDNIDPATAARVLGDDYIRWRRLDPKYSQSGYDRINEGYALLRGEGDGGPSVTAESVMGSVRPKERPDGLGEQEANNKSGDYLSDALQYADLSQLMGAPRYKFNPPGIRQGSRGTGASALKRLGIASLV